MLDRVATSTHCTKSGVLRVLASFKIAAHVLPLLSPPLGTAAAEEQSFALGHKCPLPQAVPPQGLARLMQPQLNSQQKSFLLIQLLLRLLRQNMFHFQLSGGTVL